ncbi:MFS general substrate transporter [Dothidotthia symphoricarpi CBS 119687]|uniref:MFS general substrate transporter n=1 Tax=Dothidotthia symphoricarpi CBS 119687 TaxID=1392245 RepID=A0A6A6AFH3_9PLEO|nr:MFS general substrate transporter [Dothidotthia symphoricarpi CBS 119687]KAF2129694.1 MFS general substrate transporter [Dothidotthia symphoricarpi CBS 119687]
MAEPSTHVSKTASAQGLEEKQFGLQPSTSEYDGGSVSWTVAEEKKVLRKLDFYLMPLLVLGFLVLQLDRSNISNALTDTITTDLGITSNDVNLGNQLMLAGIIISELPSNLGLQRVGAPIWLTGQMCIWGTIALAQAWVTNVDSFFATRFILGVFEGGYVPGAQYMLSLFYTREELALRTAIFYFGNYFATATGSLMAAGILQLAGRSGLSGWQWLFIIEGILTLVVFLIFVLFLPKSPMQTKPIHGYWDVFSEKDRTIMSARMHGLDRSAKANMSWIEVKEALLDVRLWLHLILNVASLAPKGGLQLYGPSVIKSLGFSKTKANALNSVSSYLVVVFSFLISYASDKTRLRGPWCIVAFAWSMAFAGALHGLPLNANRWTRYWVFTFLGSGNALAQGLNDAWLSANAKTPAKRSIGLALVVMGSNLGGLAGQQMFRTSDAPRYQRGFLAILCLYAASIAIACGIMAVYWWTNKRSAEVHTAQQNEDREDPTTQPFVCQL